VRRSLIGLNSVVCQSPGEQQFPLIMQVANPIGCNMKCLLQSLFEFLIAPFVKKFWEITMQTDLPSQMTLYRPKLPNTVSKLGVMH